MESIFEIVDNNKFLSKKVKKTHNSVYSMAYLLNKKLSQSQYIRLGLALEDIFKDIVLKYTNFVDIKEKNTKNVREKDHLFIDEQNRIVYYAEIKSNVYLDTEKVKATEQKCKDNYKELKKKYPGFKIKSKFVCLRYVDEIPIVLSNKFSIKILPINRYLKQLGIDMFFNDIEYRKFINYIADKL